MQIARSAYKYLAETDGQLLLYTSSSYTRGAPSTACTLDQAAMVNLTPGPPVDEWAGDGVRVNCINPERTATPMRTKAFGQEPAGSLLSSEAVPGPRWTCCCPSSPAMSSTYAAGPDAGAARATGSSRRWPRC
ncbi:hypothetical protein GCM10023238_28440 [Streptomyces heliomycini]